MIALLNFDKVEIEHNLELIKLIRQIAPQSTSREIDDENLATDICDHTCDDDNLELC